MSYYSQSTIAKAKEMDLLIYLQTYEPDELVRISGNTYTTKTHDSLKISNGMWMWWSRGIGGRSAVDYLIRVRGMTFIEAVSQIANDEIALRKQYEKPKPAKLSSGSNAGFGLLWQKSASVKRFYVKKLRNKTNLQQFQ